MTNGDEDTGLTATQLWAAAWILGLVGVLSWVKVASSFDGGWLACASLTTVFSACCAVLSGIKASEARLRLLIGSLVAQAQPEYSPEPDEPHS